MTDDLPTGERLQKVLARAGLGSRRTCEELIANGRVRVNGQVAELGRRVDIEHDRVEVNGTTLSLRSGLVYYLLNKPAGVVTTASDPGGRATVVQLVPEDPRVFSVGRLDANTEGLLLLTNDGDLAQRLTHPSFGVEKEYLAVVEGQPSPGAIRRLRQGVQLDDGMTAPAKVASVPPNTLRITIHEGRKRQVRRMCETVGYPVRRLVRTRIGPLTDRRLRPGAWRPLTTSEVRALESAASTKPAGPKPARSRKPTRTKAARRKPANAKDGTTKAASKPAGTTKATRNPAGTTRADPKPAGTTKAGPKPGGTTKATKKTSTKAAGTNDSTRRPSARR